MKYAVYACGNRFVTNNVTESRPETCPHCDAEFEGIYVGH